MLLGYKDHEESRVFRVHRVYQGQKACQVHLAAPGPKDREGLEGGLVLLDLKENQVLLVYLDEMDSLVLKEHKVLQASEGQWVHLGSRVQGDCQVQWGLQGHQVHLDCQGSQYVVQ